MARHAHELHEPAVVEIEDEFSRRSPAEQLVLTRLWVDALGSIEPVELPVTGAQMVDDSRDEAGW